MAKAANSWPQSQQLDEADEKEMTDNLKDLCPEGFKLIDAVVEQKMDMDLLTATLNVFKLFSTDAAVVAILPYRHLDSIITILQRDLSHNDENVRELYQLVGIEIYKLVNCSIGTQWHSYVKEFLLNVCDELQWKFSASNDDGCDEDDDEPCKPYDPQSGVASYFSREGNQVRTLPKYTMNERENTNDRAGSKTTECSKKYPMVTRGGYSNIFLFLCPVHGHCYGFHIIPGSEGRKDPFAALPKYKQDPPEHLFYDFACQFSEYALNRCEHYFKNCRCWHDLLHSFNHKCGDVFKYIRMPGIVANTEICEQFNSYLQRFKWTATHLSQERFCFMLQYAIYKWNTKQTKLIEEKKAKIANSLS